MPMMEQEMDSGASGQGARCWNQEPPQLASESWVNNKWRPAMAWLWFAVSAFDFIIFPILNAMFVAITKINYAPWQPITLQGGGLFHVAMGAVVGVSTWTRSQEKLAIYNGYYGGGSQYSSGMSAGSGPYGSGPYGGGMQGGPYGGGMGSGIPPQYGGGMPGSGMGPGSGPMMGQGGASGVAMPPPPPPPPPPGG